MAHKGPRESKRFTALPISTVDYHLDIDYAGNGIREQHLDVVVPVESAPGLPVYVYFHGGGWTSGDKSATIKYCANQAIGGMVVVNVNYRKATRFHMQHMLQDAAAALAWVRENIEGYGGDCKRVVLGGDSAGGQIASLLGASVHQGELADRFELEPGIHKQHLRGIVQHCSAVDLSVMFNPGFFLGLGFLRIQLPKDRWGHSLRGAARFLSPIEWLDTGFPPHFVTTSERDFFYGANVNFVQRLRRKLIPVETLSYDRSHKRAGHTWQQNFLHPESQEVYARVRAFVANVTKAPVLTAVAGTVGTAT